MEKYLNSDNALTHFVIMAVLFIAFVIHHKSKRKPYKASPFEPDAYNDYMSIMTWIETADEIVIDLAQDYIKEFEDYFNGKILHQNIIFYTSSLYDQLNRRINPRGALANVKQ